MVHWLSPFEKKVLKLETQVKSINKRFKTIYNRYYAMITRRAARENKTAYKREKKLRNFVKILGSRSNRLRIDHIIRKLKEGKQISYLTPREKVRLNYLLKPKQNHKK